MPLILQSGQIPKSCRMEQCQALFFETYAVAEVIKSFANKGLESPIYFYRDKDKIEIDLLIEQNGTVFPIEIKKQQVQIQTMQKFFLSHQG